MTTDPVWAPAGEILWAHHAALLAIPAFVPAVVVVGVVLYIARKDRQDEQRELAEDEAKRRADPDTFTHPTTDHPATDHEEPS